MFQAKNKECQLNECRPVMLQQVALYMTAGVMLTICLCITPRTYHMVVLPLCPCGDIVQPRMPKHNRLQNILIGQF